MQLIGPFSQIVTMANLPEKGSILDSEMEINQKAGIVIEGDKIIEIGNFESLKKESVEKGYLVKELVGNYVLIPGLIDSHTHICYSGSREKEYAARLEGKSYLEIAKMGGGIMSTVKHTRESSLNELQNLLKQRCTKLFSEGVTTCEVKSGYGLTVVDELKMLKAINQVNEIHQIDLIPTCLAAHVCPPEFKKPSRYLDLIAKELLPEVKAQSLSNRVDIFVEQGAFNEEESNTYIEEAKSLGYSVVVHADQFSIAGSKLAARYNAVSADHLEVSTENEFQLLAKNNVIGLVLPGASVGLGLPFSNARKMLDSGMCVAISSDWNPGSAPMGDLLVLASILGVYEKLTIAETMAGITCRAAKALELDDRGILEPGKLADMIAFQCSDYREIFYNQGKLKPSMVWKKGLKSNK